MSISKKRNDSNAVSLRTLEESSTSLVNDCLLPYQDELSLNYEHAQKEVPLSPSRSSYFSSPPLSESQWTPDTESEFSTEGASLLGVETPPPQYQSSPASSRGFPIPLEPLLRKLPQLGTDEPGNKGKYYCSYDGCARRKKRARVAHFVVIILLIKAFVFFMIFRHKVSFCFKRSFIQFS
jgi:hypothetical protein